MFEVLHEIGPLDVNKLRKHSNDILRHPRWMSFADSNERLLRKGWFIDNVWLLKKDHRLTTLLMKQKKRKEWDVYELIVDLLANEEVDVLEAKEERNFR
ncbi:transcription regulatory protein SNF5, putative (BSH) [Trifolium repens]|nr:transcription regulatory protein SNF5, putative (BSH) [Trifolium repens]